MEPLDLRPPRVSTTDMAAGIAVSAVAHLAILCIALFLPGWMPRETYRIPYTMVNLVTLDEISKKDIAPRKSVKKKEGIRKGKPVEQKSSGVSRKKASRLVSVKRLEFDQSKKTTVAKLRKLEPREVPQLGIGKKPGSIDKDLERLTSKPDLPKKAEKPVEGSAGGSESAASTPKASSRSARAVEAGSRSAAAAAGSSGQIGLARRLYYTEVWNAIRSNWALPDFLKDKKLEAVLIVVVRRDGKVLNIRFEKRSGNSLFDDSALRAIKKADPLPPFPAIYSPPKEEIGVRFRPEDL